MKEGVVVADGDGNREAGSGEASQNMMYTARSAPHFFKNQTRLEVFCQTCLPVL